MLMTEPLKVVNVVDSMRILINGKANLWRQTKVRYIDFNNEKDKEKDKGNEKDKNNLWRQTKVMYFHLQVPGLRLKTSMMTNDHWIEIKLAGLCFWTASGLRGKLRVTW